jgi:hypothetical protein
MSDDFPPVVVTVKTTIQVDVDDLVEEILDAAGYDYDLALSVVRRIDHQMMDIEFTRRLRQLADDILAEFAAEQP